MTSSRPWRGSGASCPATRRSTRRRPRACAVGDRAYKRCKAIHLPFLDQSTADARRALALDELPLNQELAPDTYLGVRPVRDGDDGKWILGPRDEAAADGDLVVGMRRFQLLHRHRAPFGRDRAPRTAARDVQKTLIARLTRMVSATESSTDVMRQPGPHPMMRTRR
jgi:aminoglycoside phosphotransferase family enzyme